MQIKKKYFYGEKNKYDTKLSIKYRKLANKNLPPGISRSIKGKNKLCNPNSREHSLCLQRLLEQ